MKIKFEINEIDFPKSSNNSFAVWCVPNNRYTKFIIWMLKITGSVKGRITCILI